jgi:elongation factor G
MEKNCTPEFIRNTVIAGAPNSGKTTVAEAMLFTSGKIPHMGSIEKGNTIMDFDEEEIKKKMSLKTSLAYLEWKDTKINVLDVPGIPDLSAELRSALSSVESVIFVINATSGISIDCEKNWNIAEGFKIPKVVLINKMDAENADYFKLLIDLEAKFRKSFVPFVLPIGSGPDFKGVFDLLRLKPFYVDKNNKSENVPENIKDILSKYREKIFEAAAESDDKLIEKYLNGGELSEEELETGIRNSIKNNAFIPVLCSSAINNAGISNLIDILVAYFPSPLYVNEFEGKNPANPEQKITRKQKADEPFSGFIFKTRIDPFAGKMSFCRIKSGTLSLGADIYDVNRNKKEKIGRASCRERV